MAEQPALPQVHGIRMRVANLDSNGVPTPGASNLYVSAAFTKVTLSPVYTTGTEIEQKNAQGQICVNYRSADSLKRMDVSVELCSFDPYLAQMLSGGALVTDAVTPARIGWKAPAIGPIADDGGISIEVWTRRIDDGEEDADSPYGWWIYPRIKNLQFSGYAHEDNPLLMTFSGQAYENPNWFDGPLNDWPNSSDSDRVVAYLPTGTLPTASVGYQTIAAS